MEQVERDMENGYVSLEGARESYGVVIDPETLTVDREETEKLRESLKKLVVYRSS
jgi:N-methylhydantoinase B/oxoprolinase/acetone carboxylase alpha subunit